jgi:PTS system mannose-specific IIC component
MLIKSVIVALAGGLICLDRIFIQAMISRPIVAGPLTGLILNDPYTGLVAGAFIELFWIDRFPIGVYVPPNDTIVSILATAGAVLAGGAFGQVSRELLALAILLFLPCGVVGQKIDMLVFSSNERLSDKAMKDAKEGNSSGISQQHLLGLLKMFLSTTVVLFIFSFCGVHILLWLFPVIPEHILKALLYMYYIIPIIGVAVALNTIKLRGAIPVFSGIFLISVLIIEIL